VSFFSDLVARVEERVDSLVAALLVGVVATVAYQGYALYQDHSTWSPIAFDTGLATLVGAAHTAKGFRDRGKGDDDVPHP
jgi:hypothetical protein